MQKKTNINDIFYMVNELNLIDWNIRQSYLFDIDNKCDKTLLSEDMFQIEKNDYIIDAGWYNNIFITYLIYKYDWENPIITIKSDILKNCIFAIGLTIQYAEKIMNKKSA